MNIPINLAVEDRLSEAVLRRILSHSDRGYALGACYKRGGYGYLKKNIRGWNAAARSVPFIVLTDLDASYPCPGALILDWLPLQQRHNLLFRVAIREVEAWLIADRTNLAAFLRVPERLIPENPDRVPDPKRAIVELARKSRDRWMRERIAPKPKSTASQGPDYNGCLIEFVTAGWDIEAAIAGSESLRRTVRKLHTFTPVWEEK